MTSNPTPDRLDDLRAEYANTGMVTSDGAVWLFSQVVVLREQVKRLTSAPAAVSSVVGQATRDRIAEALALRENGPASDGRGWFRDEEQHQSFLTDADAVLAVLPPPVDRGAEIERLREQLEEAEDTAEQLVRNVQTVARERESYRKAWKEERQRRVKAEREKPPAVLREAAEAVAADIEHIRYGSATDYAERHADLLRRLADEAQQPEPPAAECSAQHRNFDDGRLCIRAAQHRGDHIDERGFHWSDTVAVYPVGGGTFRSGVRPSAVGARQPDTQTPCERCGHTRQAHNISGCTACPGGWRADHRFTSVDEPPADPWSVEYHRMGAARLNPAVCTCGLGPDAIVHNEPPHAFNGRPKPGMPGVYGICTDCHHHETAACHVASSAVPGRSAATDTHEETPRQSCACGQDGCEYCDVEDADEETSR